MEKQLQLWIDDIRPIPDNHRNTEWMVARTYAEAIALIDEYDFDFISFDHDLGDLWKTGYDVACHLEENCIIRGRKIPRGLLCHSANPVGKQKIIVVLRKLSALRRERDA